MPSKNNRLYSLILLIVDIVALLGAFSIAYILRVQYDSRPLLNNIYAIDYLKSFVLITPFWLIIFASLGLYNANVYNRRIVEWSKIALGSFIGILMMIGWEYTTETIFFPARLVVAYALLGSFVLIIFERELLRAIRSLLFQVGIGTSRVMIIGNSPATKDIALSMAETSRSGFEIVAISGPKKCVPKELSDVIHFKKVEDALNSVKTLKINTIIQTDFYDNNSHNNENILGVAQINYIDYNFIPGDSEFYTGKNTVDVFLGYPMISVSQTPLIGWGAIAKRIFDTIASFILIILLSPVFATLIIIQKLTNPGPIFYKSKRLSQFSKPIEIYKFRSMGAEFGKKDAAEEFKEMGLPKLAKEYEKNRKVDDDPRITKFGKFLRSTSLDELPQLFNVLKGDLSLVGPRPILPQEVSLIKGRSYLLHSVKSGVTGLWQVSGRSNLSFDERIELEQFYAQNWTFWLDIKILIKTIMVVIRKTGAK